MENIDIQEQLNAQYTKILNCESNLKSTDYIAAKIAEGKATQVEYAEQIAQRQEWRDEINAAQAEIGRLKAIEAEQVEIEKPNEIEE